MNEEKQVDIDHSKPVKKLAYYPLIESDLKNMTYGKVYEVFQVLNNRLYKIRNDVGEKVWMKQEEFDELPSKEFLKGQMRREACDNLWEKENLQELTQKIELLRRQPVEDLNNYSCREIQVLCGLNKEPKYINNPNKKTFGTDNIDAILANVSKEFPSNYSVYLSINPDDFLEVLKKKMGYEFSIQGDFLAVNGMITKFKKESIDNAHRALKCIVGNVKATKIVARAIKTQLKKIF
jgi:hypothetical protein